MLNVPFGLNYPSQEQLNTVAKVQTGVYDTLNDMRLLEHVFGEKKNTYQNIYKSFQDKKSNRTTRHKAKSRKEKKNKTARK